MDKTNNKHHPKLVLLGVGQAASYVAKEARERYRLFGTTRNPDKVDHLREQGMEPILLAESIVKDEVKSLTQVFPGAFVLVSFPPDGHSDRLFVELAKEAKRIIYISSTSVYGRRTGIIDDTIPVDQDYAEAQDRLAAEQIWRGAKAIILRAPGLYGPDSGLHVRLKGGSYRLPGNGSNFTSRIHLHDLARIILATFESEISPGSTYVVGDSQPTTQREVISWLCRELSLPMPDSIPLSSSPSSLQANRQIVASKILQELGLTLKFPTYREGFADCLKKVSASANT